MPTQIRGVHAGPSPAPDPLIEDDEASRKYLNLQRNFLLGA
jgi:hypothetical protein